MSEWIAVEEEPKQPRKKGLYVYPVWHYNYRTGEYSLNCICATEKKAKRKIKHLEKKWSSREWRWSEEYVEGSK